MGGMYLFVLSIVFNPRVGNRLVIANAQLSLVDQEALARYKKSVKTGNHERKEETVRK